MCESHQWQVLDSISSIPDGDEIGAFIQEGDTMPGDFIVDSIAFYWRSDFKLFHQDKLVALSVKLKSTSNLIYWSRQSCQSAVELHHRATTLRTCVTYVDFELCDEIDIVHKANKTGAFETLENNVS